MQMALDTEEACAHIQRRLDPHLIDNVVADMETQRLGKPCGDIQFTRMFLRAEKMSSERKRAIAGLFKRWEKVN